MSIHRTLSIYIGTTILLSLVAACGSNGGGGAKESSRSAVISSAGGSLTGPDGVQVEFPPGALDQPTTISIARSAAGAPTAPAAINFAGSIYELTPHDQPFNLPVTIRIPVPSGATGTTVFIASPGHDWSPKDASMVNGMAEIERGSFSWFGVGWGCSIPMNLANDPYWCLAPTSRAYINATPSQALTQTSPAFQNANGWYGGGLVNGGAGSYRVDAAASLHFQSQFNIPGNCRNVSVTLSRSRINGVTAKWDPRQIIMTSSPVVSLDGHWLSGTAVFDVQFTSQDNGKNVFYLEATAECPRAYYSGNNGNWDTSNYQTVTAGDDTTFVEGNIAIPTVLYTVGGNVTGLTGAGLVLQNNGGDNLPVSASGPFTFSTSLVAGASYGVSVQTQPTDQNCTVQNASGTVQANIANVAVTCVDLPVVINPVNPSAYGCSRDTVTFTASKGTPPFTWSSSEVGSSNLTVINATQAQWHDGNDRFCSSGGTVTITVTDSTGASAASVMTVLK